MLEFIRTMNKAERKHWANFILTYPVQRDISGIEELAQLAAEQKADLVESSQNSVDPGTTYKVVVGAIYTPDVPFSPDAPPLPVGATVAPISAGVEASKTVLETGGTISNSPNIPGSIPYVPRSGNMAETAVLPVINPVPLDSEGLPWDARIHASTKTKIANGSWKLIRGCDPAKIAEVKAELQALMNVPVTQVHTPVVASPITTDQRLDFIGFIEKITELIKGKRITEAEILKCCTDSGVAAPNMLAARPDLVPQVMSKIEALIANRTS